MIPGALEQCTIDGNYLEGHRKDIVWLMRRFSTLAGRRFDGGFFKWKLLLKMGSACCCTEHLWLVLLL